MMTGNEESVSDFDFLSTNSCSHCEIIVYRLLSLAARHSSIELVRRLVGCATRLGGEEHLLSIVSRRGTRKKCERCR